MRTLGYLFALVLLLLGSPASAQDPPKGFLGIDLKDITKEEAGALGWEAPRGIKVVKPREDGPASRAGILPDDVILSIDGVEVENMQRFIAIIGDRGAGAQVRLRVLRSGKEHTLNVTLGQRPPEPVAVREACRCSCSRLAGTWRSSQALPSRQMANSWSLQASTN